MNIHHNARLTFRGRELLVKRIVEQGLRVEEAAQASGVSVRTAYKWLRRYRHEGITGLYDRSSRHCYVPVPCGRISTNLPVMRPPSWSSSAVT